MMSFKLLLIIALLYVIYQSSVVGAHELLLSALP